MSKRKQGVDFNLSEKPGPKKPRAPPKKPPVLFEGENHGILWVPGKGFERANYMGPGTKVNKRIRMGYVGKTPVDAASQVHDIDYGLASATAKTDEELGKLGREADDRMIRTGWKAYQAGNENLFNLIEGPGLIKAKEWLEDWGLLSPTKFLSPRSFKYKMRANKRDASEYEILLRARSELVCSRTETGDEEECSKTTKDLGALH